VDVSVSYTLDPGQLRRALRRRSGTWPRYVLPACGAVVVADAVVQHQSLGVVWGVVLLLFPLLLEWSLRTGVRRVTATLTDGLSARLTDEGLWIRSRHTETSLDWGAFTEARLVRGVWMLRQRTRTYTPIPAGAFTAQDAPVVAEFFARRLPPRSRAGRRAAA
jgi:hypothetical protein